MNVRKKLESHIECVCIGPHISECIISSGAQALIDLPIENDFLCCFPKIQRSHILSDFLINVKPFSIFFICSSFIPQKSKCPNLKSRLILNLWLKCYLYLCTILLFFLGTWLVRFFTFFFKCTARVHIICVLCNPSLQIKPYYLREINGLLSVMP